MAHHNKDNDVVWRALCKTVPDIYYLLFIIDKTLQSHKPAPGCRLEFCQKSYFMQKLRLNFHETRHRNFREITTSETNQLIDKLV